MTLPYDVSRCVGTTAPLCQSCRRTEPGRAEYQSMIEPRIIGERCPHYIAKMGDDR